LKNIFKKLDNSIALMFPKRSGLWHRAIAYLPGITAWLGFGQCGFSLTLSQVGGGSWELLFAIARINRNDNLHIA
jgi:hypothetical protein